MKITKLIISLFFLSALSGCVDTEENIVINADNSGIYTLQIDMGKVITMANQMGAQETDKSRKLEKIDSTIYLKQLILASDSLNAEEKELYKEGTIRIKVDKAKEEMKITMTCPFKLISQLPQIKDNFYLVINKLKALDKLSGKEESSAELPPAEGMSEKALNPSATYYKFSAQPGRIEYSVIDPAGFTKQMASDSTMMMMQQMMAMMGEITYKTRITASREIKNYSGNNISLSTDKKTIMFTSSFAEMLAHPEKAGYKIEY